MNFPKLAAPLLALGLMFGCGGGGTLNNGGPAKGSLDLYLGADAIPGYTQVVVSIDKVEWTADGITWTPLGTVAKTLNLASLQNGNAASGLLLTGASINAGTISKLRITWSKSNYNATPVPQPAAFVSDGVKGGVVSMPDTTVVTGPFTVRGSGTTQAQIMIQGSQTIQNRGGSPATFSFQGEARVYDPSTCARISGTLSVGSTPLNGVEVYAEAFTGTTASIVRRSLTDDKGAYTLEALPTGTTYFVVAQPAGTTTSYYAKASSDVVASASGVYKVDMPFDVPLGSGALAVAITPASPASAATWVELRQTLQAGLNYHEFIVRSLTATTSGSSDQALFTGLATTGMNPGSYSVRALRSTGGAAPVAKDLATAQSIQPGATTNASIAF